MSAKMSPERKDLEALTKAVREFLATLDAEMNGPSTPERGRRIATLSNALEMVNDRVRYGTLGVDFRKDRPVPPSKTRTLAASLEAAARRAE